MAKEGESEYRCTLTWMVQKIGEEDKEPMALSTNVWAGANYETMHMMQSRLIKAIVTELEAMGYDAAKLKAAGTSK
jgi:hypothetical protein